MSLAMRGGSLFAVDLSCSIVSHLRRCSDRYHCDSFKINILDTSVPICKTLLSFPGGDMRTVMKWSIAVLLGWSAVAWGQTVELFSPTGTVKQVRQVTARFTTQMVAFGDMRTSD